MQQRPAHPAAARSGATLPAAPGRRACAPASLRFCRQHPSCADPSTLATHHGSESRLLDGCVTHWRSVAGHCGARILRAGIFHMARLGTIERLRRRKPDLDAQTWVVIHHFDARIVQLCDRSDEAKAEDIAGVAPAALKAIKALEDALVLVQRNSGTAISDGNRRASRILVDIDHNPARPAVPDSVVEEI